MKRNKKEQVRTSKMPSIVKGHIRDGKVWWMTAQEITKETNGRIDRKILYKGRQNKWFTFQELSDRSFRYDLTSINEFLEEYKKLQLQSA